MVGLPVFEKQNLIFFTTGEGLPSCASFTIVNPASPRTWRSAGFFEGGRYGALRRLHGGGGLPYRPMFMTGTGWLSPHAWRSTFADRYNERRRNVVSTDVEVYRTRPVRRRTEDRRLHGRGGLPYHRIETVVNGRSSPRAWRSTAVPVCAVRAQVVVSTGVEVSPDPTPPWQSHTGRLHGRGGLPASYAVASTGTWSSPRTWRSSDPLL